MQARGAPPWRAPLSARAQPWTPACGRLSLPVRRDGDAALRRLTKRFDGVDLDKLAVRPAERAVARRALTPEQHGALERAIDNVHTFHAAQELAPFTLETAPGVRCERLIRPISAVGLYVPAGSRPTALDGHHAGRAGAHCRLSDTRAVHAA